VSPSYLCVIWCRRYPSACPYSQRFWLELPRPFVTHHRLCQVIAPVPGERILEVGVGTGYYALKAVEWVKPGGTIHAVDIQQQMVDHAARRAHELAINNIELRVADACAPPYPDNHFDCAYLVTVLDEIPDQDAALREVRRVLRPGGRLVVGELIGDPHMVGFGTLCKRAETVGLCYGLRLDGWLGYLARFVKITGVGATP
jgi:ubiquinone/menaquinone biosynthesis C-methylase UbiE